MSYYDTSYPPSLFDGRNSASDDDAFFDKRVTAQDLPNANNLISYGFIADPQTAWNTGDGIYVNSNMRFNWNGTNWLPGLAVVDEPEEPEPEEPEPEPESQEQTFTAIPVDELPITEEIPRTD